MPTVLWSWLLVCCASTPPDLLLRPQDVREAPAVVFHGNRVLPDEVYRAVLSPPGESETEEAAAAAVRDQLLGFLHRAGYELAVVRAAHVGGQLHVFIDEGQLGKIILRGRGSWGTLKARSALALPHKVFNRPELERRIRRLRSRSGLDIERYELVPSSDVAHSGPQLENLGPVVDDVVVALFGQALIPSRGQHDLQVTLRKEEWARGPRLGAGLSGPDGFLANLEYRGAGLLWEGDRWLGRLELGSRARTRISDHSSYVAFTRGDAAIAWTAPRRLWQLLPGVELRSQYASRQRPDLSLENYDRLRLQSLFVLQAPVRRGATLTLGAGVERLEIFALEPAGAPPLPEGVFRSGSTRPVVSALLEMVFAEDELRSDRNHELSLSAQHLPPWRGSEYGVARWKYQQVFAHGWHDLWIASTGAVFWGSPPFVEETSVGGALVRGVFADRYFSRRAGSLSLEWRFSLVRDVYKLALFNDAALFEAPAREAGGDRLRFADSVGLGICALIADAFQLGVYYGVGFSATGRVDHGISASLRQAF